MRNRAKCKLCKNVIESYHATDRVSCMCGEIAIDGGLSALKVYANDLHNVIRVDDQDNEIVTTVQGDEPIAEPTTKPSKNDLLDMLDNMIESYEKLPQAALNAPITHYDMTSALLLLRELLRL